MSEYYERVATYFDEDAEQWDDRYCTNPIAQRIRQAFREEVKRLPFRKALEVGCGTGFDLVHFGTIYPERSLLGIDVSSEMVRLAKARITRSGQSNAQAAVASVERAPDLLGAGAFDLCYVFFGALNTVEDLHRSADRLYDATAPGGYVVLTFVNRWYLAEMAVALVRGQWKRAFRRLRTVWGGYNPDRPLPSCCVTPREVRRAFGRGGRMLKRRGFSITYPAWYWSRWLPKLGRTSHWLWELDRWLNRTPAWSTGEYALYVFRKNSGVPA